METVKFEIVVDRAKQILIPAAVAAILVSAVLAQTSPAPATPQASNPAPSAAPAHAKKKSPYASAEKSLHAERYFQAAWGVDSLSVKAVESGQMIRFSYRILDPAKAKPLNDKKVTPYLMDEQAHVKLIVPTLEKVGQLRQSSTPESGRIYWMVFSNKERFVKPGNRVTVVIGKFRVDDLVVQ